MLSVVLGMIFIMTYIFILVLTIIYKWTWIGWIIQIILAVTWQLINASLFNANIIKSKSIESFGNKQKILYKVSIVMDLLMFSIVVLMFADKTVHGTLGFIKIAIIIGWGFWTILLLLRDALSLKDLILIEKCNYNHISKTIKVSKIDKHLVNNKYSIWYMKDNDKRKKDIYKSFKIGNSYELSLITIGSGDYIVDFKEIANKQ